jgi:hypothetical protein
MKKYLFAYLALLVGTAPAKAQTNTNKDSGMKTSVLSESWVQVDKIELPVGGMLPTHKGLDRIAISLSDYNIELEEVGGAKNTKSWKRGEVHWHGSKEHSVKNVGSTPARFLVIAKLRSDSILGKPIQEHKHIAGGDDNLPKVVFDNDFAVVSEVVLQPGQKQSPHQSDRRVVVALSDYEIVYNSETVKDRKVAVKSESVHTHEADRHFVSNVGKTAAHFLVVVLK